MNKHIPLASLSAVQPTRIIYFVTYDGASFGQRVTGSYEMDFDRNTRSSIVQEIIEGQFHFGIDRIYEAEVGGLFCDVTEDIAREVSDYLFNERIPVSHDLKCFLHNNHPAGVCSTHGMVEAAHDRS